MSGEIEVHIYRSERSFSDSVLIHRQNPISGKREALSFDDEGRGVWTVIEGNVIVHPTFEYYPEIMRALVKAWTERDPSVEPGTTVLDALETHLYDAREVRDKLLEIVTHRMIK